MATIISGAAKGLEHSAKQRKGKFIPGLFLTLRDGQTAKIRFLTDEPKILSAVYHYVPSSKQGISFPEICAFELGEDDCEYCTNVEWGLNKGRRLYSMFVWLYTFMDEKGTTTKVNAPKVWRTGPGKGNYIMNSVVSFAQKYTTLCDRTYDLKRTGKTQDDTFYSLVPDDKSPLETEVNVESAKLPPLEAVVTGGAFEWPWAKKEAKGQESPVSNNSALLKRLRAKKPAAEAGEEL